MLRQSLWLDKFYYRVQNPETFLPSMRTALKWALAPNRWLAARGAAAGVPSEAQRRRDELSRAVAAERQRRQRAAERRQRGERQVPHVMHYGSSL